MSSEFEFELKREARNFRSQLARSNSVEQVLAPRIFEQDGSQYVSFGIIFKDSVTDPDVKLKQELLTVAEEYLGPKHDVWLGNEIPSCYGTINTYGLNPNPGGDIGSM